MITRTTAELERELEGMRMEKRAMLALTEMYSHQKPAVNGRRVANSSHSVFTDEELARGMRNYEHNIAAVAKHFNVSMVSIYGRLRELPPGAVDCSEKWAKGAKD